MLLFQLFALPTLAQSSLGFTLSGTITDEKNELLTGVNVLEKNTTKDTVSDDKCRFTCLNI